MHTIDWIILVVVLLSTVVFGIVKGKHSKNLKGYFLSDQNLKWYSVGLSVVATQASAITFLSTPGQAYGDGLRFIQFYLGLPLAMAFIIFVLVPLYKRHNVFTAYEYLEKRFDLKTRVLGAFLFLIQRGMAVGFTIYAPSLVLSNILGWDIYMVSFCIGLMIIIYSVLGGTRAVSFTHKLQMGVIFGGIFMAFYYLLNALPEYVTVANAWDIADEMGRINPIDWSFDLTERYNIWSGVIGGFFLAVAYFGTDQSQVQRYLSGKSAKQAKLGLVFNGVVKIPLQLFILVIGIFLFVFYQFNSPELHFNNAEQNAVLKSEHAGEYKALQKEFNLINEEKKDLLSLVLVSPEEEKVAIWKDIKEKEKEAAIVKSKGIELVKLNRPGANGNDLDQIFISFVVNNLPVGLVGLLIAAILSASMSSAASILNALSATSTIDIYKRLFCKKEEQAIDLSISKWITVFWGIGGILFSFYANKLGNLIQAVNILGSLFYGSILGIFVIAIFFKKIGGTAVFIAAIVGQIMVFYCFFFTSISYLWYNVLGCLLVVFVSYLVQRLLPATVLPNPVIRTIAKGNG